MGKLNLRGRLYCAAALAKGTAWRRHLREMESARPEEMSARYLADVLRHAVAHVPYYAALDRSGPDLGSFPLLTRRDLRENFERLKSADLDQRRSSKACTGGSSGEPVWVLRDREFRDWDRATDMYYIKAMLGIPLAEYLSGRILLLWHQRRHGRRLSPAGLVTDLLRPWTRIEPYEALTDDMLERHVQTINDARPLVIWAFASSLFEIARYAKRKGLAVHRPRLIISSVETLYPHMRSTIETVFACPVRNFYGSVETGHVAGECSSGRMHVFAFGSHVEVLDAQNKPVSRGEKGRLVITPLHNSAMPLLRYDIGDMARSGSGSCSCGSSLPVLDEVLGRVNEHFVTTDDRLIYGGYFVAMFYTHEWIAEFQVLQLEVDLIEIYFRRMPGRDVPPLAFAEINEDIRRVMGPGCRIEWCEVAAVPRTPIGKHLHSRSLVWEARQQGKV